MALTVVSMLITPVFYMISNALRASARFRDQTSRLFVMKNFMVKQTYEAQQDKEQQKSKDKKIKEPAVTLNYARKVVGKAKPFDKFSKEELQNLCVQKVTASFDKQKEFLVSFLYKPKL
ncbi:hypothetical protein ACFLYU_05735 [Candidatus Dependentiae bacterium]